MKSPSPRKRNQSAARNGGNVHVQFSCDAPDATAVFVAGSFNEWQVNAQPLRRQKNGAWLAELDLPPGRYEYLFVVDGHWMPDPNSRNTIPNPFGGENSILIVELTEARVSKPVTVDKPVTEWPETK